MAKKPVKREEVITPAGSMRVWHIPQIPGKPFHVKVKTLREAKVVLRALADYDAFQFENNIKPDYSNAQGLEVFERGEWSEWESKTGENIDHYMRGDL
jgi:hypothetical protein